MITLSGKDVAKALQSELKARVDALYLNYVFPVLATLRVGEDPAAVSYENGLRRAAEATGVLVRRYILPARVSTAEVAGLIDQINADPLLSGLLLLRPLPAELDEAALCANIAPQKDVDCANAAQPGRFVPCTAEACMQILRHYEIPVEGKHAVVLGRSKTVGLPLARLLLSANATVTVCHSRTPDPAALTRQAELVVAAAGRRAMLRGGDLKPGAVVLDVGIHRDPETGRLCGDCAPDAADVAGALTPVPGGVGAVTSTILMRHVIDAAERSAK